jgi:hypothetical protein
MLLCKDQFEHEARTHGIDVKKYHTGNGIFVSADWKEHLHGMQQTQRLSATGAHHQSAITERAIQTVTKSAQAMLLHLNVHWPDKYDTQLWPFALQYVAWLYNYPPKTNNLAPIKIFTCQMTTCELLGRAKVFGCPIYILEPHLQDGKKLPKWGKTRPISRILQGTLITQRSCPQFVEQLNNASVSFHCGSTV